MKIEIIIPNDKLEDFRLGFLKAYPKPNGVTDLQHIKQFIRTQLFKYYRTGKILIARETTPVEIDGEVIEE